MAVLALGLVGAALAPAGYASAGFLVGSVIGNALFGNKLPDQVNVNEGPRLDDLKVSASSYGKGIPWIRGTMRVAGNIIWATDVVENVTESTVTQGGGKGGDGGSQTVVTRSFYYTVKFAVLLCEGPIVGVSRVWINGSLIYDVRSGAAPDVLFASDNLDITVHLGTSGQDPDATIESIKGVGNTPAYRGSAYVVFNNFNLTDYNIRTLGMANFEFEVVVNGSSSSSASVSTIFEATGAQLPFYPAFTDPGFNVANSNLGEIWMASGVEASIFVDNYLNINGYTGEIIATLPTFVDGATRPSINFADRDGNGYLVRGGGSQKIWKVSRAGILQGPITATVSSSPGLYGGLVDTAGRIWCSNNDFGSNMVRIENINWDDGTCDSTIVNNAAGRAVLNGAIFAGDYGRIYVGAVNTGGGFNDIGYINVADNSIVAIHTASVFGSSVSRYMVGTNGFLYGCLSTGRLLKMDLDGGDIWEAALPGSGAGTYPEIIGMYNNSEVLVHGSDGVGTRKFWRVNADSGSIIETTNIPHSVTNWIPQMNAIVNGRPMVFDESTKMGILFPEGTTILSEPADLDDVVEELCQRPVIGSSQLPVLASGDLDVTQLAGGEVTGVAMADRGPIRSMLESLMLIYLFDAVESEWKVKFVPRGQASSATIDQGLLNARPDSLDAPSDIPLLTRKPEMDLPLGVSVSYMSLASDYQIMTQKSRRGVVNSQSFKDLQLPAVLTDDQARSLATTYEYLAWAEQNGLQFTLPRTYLAIEPTDVITVPVNDGEDIIVRVTKKTENPLGEISFEGVMEDASIYDQSISGIPSQPPNTTIPSAGPTFAELLDMPMILTSTNDPGFIFAAYGLIDGWHGAQLYQSKDGGAGYSALFNASLLSQSNLGHSITALGDFDDLEGNEMFDEVNTVDVLLADSDMSFASSSRANVLLGANYFMVGSELIQAISAELIATNTCRLSRLLRGRKGTEWAMTGHAVGELVVSIATDNSIASVPQNFGELGASYTYKAVSLGGFLESTAPFTFTNNGVRRKPLAPWAFAGGRNAAGDLIMKWVPRTRFPVTWNSGINAPLGETSELYAVYIPSFDAPIRIITSTTSEATYTAAQQTEDYGAPQDPITCDVVQISAEVGAGYPTSGEF